MSGISVAVTSANLGSFDKKQNHVPQEYHDGDVAYHTWTDENFEPRKNSMTPRLQARIPKMMSWNMLPGHDFYLWVDSSCQLADKGSVKWFMDQLGSADFAFFRHNKRKTVGEEAEYLRKRLDMGCPYITPRYKGEHLDRQMAVIEEDNPLFATTAFIYNDTKEARDALTLWWLHTSLYHSIDQLSLYKAVTDAGASYNVIDEDYLKCKYLEYIRV